MAIRVSGEVSAELDGEPVLLRLPMGAIMAIEDHFDRGISTIVEEAFTGRLTYLAALFVAMTDGDMKDKDTMDRATQLMIKHSKRTLSEKMAECVRRTFAIAEAEDGTQS